MSQLVLLSDFGSRDHYVGVLHAVLAARAPGVDRIDLCHQVAAGDVWHASFLLRAAAPWLADDAVILAVVDPGVGSSRRALAVRCGRRWLVAPDNGLATALGAADEVVELDRGVMGLPQPSSTFHGRDLFAPAAALLARGASPDGVGRTVSGAQLAPCPLPTPRSDGDRVLGAVLHVDHFGNLVSNLKIGEHADDAAIGWRGGCGRRVGCYAEGGRGEVVTVAGSSGYLELAVNQGSAAVLSGLARGDQLWLPAGATLQCGGG